MGIEMATAIYGQRIAEIRKKIGLSQRAFGSKVSRSQGFISDIEAGRTDPSFDFLVKLWRELGVDPRWVITGEGNELQAQAQFQGRTSLVSAPDTSVPAHGDVIIGDAELQMVRRFDVSGSAGLGALVPSEEVIDHVAFTRSWLLRMGINADLAGLLKVSGDSMAPNLRDGSLALVHFAEFEVDDGYIYAFLLNEELFIKRLARIDGGFLVTSDNPTFQPYKVLGNDAKELRVRGRVRAVISQV
ncbi:XRE family transcriptional regulator [Salipiger mucosus]|uniref:XRE family transcriptional regulator n=1 Tax=Salipiger mucosus TaxID=263378 RepID=UPI000369ABC2|nr:S24 family peptidase [Salipiger mucosus]